jgi:hypothetical protein
MAWAFVAEFLWKSLRDFRVWIGKRIKLQWPIKQVGAAILALAIIVSAHAQGAPQPPRGPQNACELAAFNDYIKENNTLLQAAVPIMSVEATIAQRRLEEQFCARFVQCGIADTSSVPFRAIFAACLRDEALEKYEAVQK